MLVNNIDIISDSDLIFQFNVTSLEFAKYILEECESKKRNVILGFSESAVNYMGGYNVVVSLVKALISDLNISIKVSIHLDHGKSVSSCINSIDAGFTSVMFDGSKLDLDKNISYTREIIEYAHKKGVSVEGEVGIVPKIDDSNLNNSLCSVEDCKKFVLETGVDFLAPFIGNIHGSFMKNQKLNFDLLKNINNTVKVLLVLHGGSGIKIDDLIFCKKNGIKKININTNLQVEMIKSIREYLNSNKNIYDYRKMIGSSEYNLKKVINQYLDIINR